MPDKTMMGKEYLGDGVYVEYDDVGVVLTTENGYNVTNRIVLDPCVWFRLMRYVQRLFVEDI